MTWNDNNSPCKHVNSWYPNLPRLVTVCHHQHIVQHRSHHPPVTVAAVDWGLECDCHPSCGCSLQENNQQLWSSGNSSSQPSMIVACNWVLCSSGWLLQHKIITNTYKYYTDISVICETFKSRLYYYIRHRMIL